VEVVEQEGRQLVDTHLLAFFFPPSTWNVNATAGAAAIQRHIGFIMEMLHKF